MIDMTYNVDKKKNFTLIHAMILWQACLESAKNFPNNFTGTDDIFRSIINGDAHSNGMLLITILWCVIYVIYAKPVPKQHLCTYIYKQCIVVSWCIKNSIRLQSHFLLHFKSIDRCIDMWTFNNFLKTHTYTSSWR